MACPRVPGRPMSGSCWIYDFWARGCSLRARLLWRLRCCPARVAGLVASEEGEAEEGNRSAATRKQKALRNATAPWASMIASRTVRGRTRSLAAHTNAAATASGIIPSACGRFAAMGKLKDSSSAMAQTWVPCERAPTWTRTSADSSGAEPTASTIHPNASVRSAAMERSRVARSATVTIWAAIPVSRVQTSTSQHRYSA